MEKLTKKQIKKQYKDLTYNYPKNKACRLQGWICPVCGKGLSPYTTECSCVWNKQYTFHYNWTNNTK